MHELILDSGILRIYDSHVDIVDHKTRKPIPDNVVFTVRGTGKKWTKLTIREIKARVLVRKDSIINLINRKGFTSRGRKFRIGDILMSFIDGIPKEVASIPAQTSKRPVETNADDAMKAYRQDTYQRITGKGKKKYAFTEYLERESSRKFNFEAEGMNRSNNTEWKEGTDPAIHYLVDTLLNVVPYPPVNIHPSRMPEDMIVDAIDREGYIPHIIYEFMKQPQWAGLFKWVAVNKNHLMNNVTHKTNTRKEKGVKTFSDILKWNNDSITLLREQVQEIIKSIALTSAYMRSDREDLLMAYITGHIEEFDEDNQMWIKRPFVLFDREPELRHLMINNVNIKRKFNDRMGKGRYAKKKGGPVPADLTLESIPNPEIAKTGKIIGELVIKDGAEEIVARGCMKEELNVYDPEYREHRLEDLRLRLWQIISADRDHLGKIIWDHPIKGDWYKEKVAAFGYGTVKEVLTEMKKVWDSKRPSFLNYVTFNKYTVLSRLNNLWNNCDIDQVVLSNPNLEYSVGRCVACDHLVIPGKKGCPKCGGMVAKEKQHIKNPQQFIEGMDINNDPYDYGSHTVVTHNEDYEYNDNWSGWKVKTQDANNRRAGYKRLHAPEDRPKEKPISVSEEDVEETGKLMDKLLGFKEPTERVSPKVVRRRRPC